MFEVSSNFLLKKFGFMNLIQWTSFICIYFAVLTLVYFFLYLYLYENKNNKPKIVCIHIHKKDV